MAWPNPLNILQHRSLDTQVLALAGHHGTWIWHQRPQNRNPILLLNRLAILRPHFSELVSSSINGECPISESLTKLAYLRSGPTTLHIFKFLSGTLPTFSMWWRQYSPWAPLNILDWNEKLHVKIKRNQSLPNDHKSPLNCPMSYLFLVLRLKVTIISSLLQWPPNQP